MTLQTSGTMTDANLMTEIRVDNPSRAYPLSLTDPDVLALAGKSAPPVTMPTDFYGKSSYTPMSGSVPNVSGTAPSGPVGSYQAHVSVSISITGGKAPFSCVWSHVSGMGTVTAATSTSTTANFTVVSASQPGDVQSQVVQCVVTDATGAQMTRQGTATLTLT